MKGEEEARRVRELKEYGMRCIPYRLPADWRAKVIAALQEQVTAARVPSWLSHSDQRIAVQGIVNEVRRSYEETVARQEESMRKEEEAKRKEAEAQREAELEDLRRKRRVEELIRHGIGEADEETRDWDFSAKYKARREVREALEDEVTAEWDEQKVEELVHRRLDELYDEDDEDDGGWDEW